MKKNKNRKTFCYATKQVSGYNYITVTIYRIKQNIPAVVLQINLAVGYRISPSFQESYARMKVIRALKIKKMVSKGAKIDIDFVIIGL
jgi:hypothetical protein